MATPDRPDPAHLEALGLTEAEFEAMYQQAGARGQAVVPDETRVVGARYDQASGRIVIDLANDMTLLVPVTRLQALAGASPEDLVEIVISGTHTLAWPRIDQQVFVPDLLVGITGTRRWMTEHLRRAGQVTSPAKAAAARANGRKGGRPRKPRPANG